MNTDCVFAKRGGHCLCSVCRSMAEDMEKIEQLDTEKIFKDAEKEFELIGKEIENGGYQKCNK